MEILKKIIAVQDAMEPIKKNKSNTHFKNTYFDKDTLLGILKPILEEQGLRLFQPLIDIQGRPAMQLLFIDTANTEQVWYTFPMPDLQDPQKMGGAITYYQRYTLVSFFGLESEDDDGNKASGVAVPKTAVASPSASGSNQIEWTLESAGAALITLRGATKPVKDWDTSSRAWVLANHKNPMVVSAVKYYNEHEVPFV